MFSSIGNFFKTKKQEIKNETSANTDISEQDTNDKSQTYSAIFTKLDELELDMKQNVYYDALVLYSKFYDERLKNWKYVSNKFSLSNQKDEHRPENASKNGGMDFNNKEATSLIRSTGYDIIKQIGKKILSGDFNLTTISFPIKVMIPLTILQTIANSIFQFPIYLNLASEQIDPVEKFKFLITATLSCFHCSSHFLKPLNPILGETYEMFYEDGSKIYLEQSSHHPPISHYYMLGPNNNYKFYGYSDFSSSAGLNSIKLTNKGKRYIEFKDGTKMMSNFCQELYSNSFMGVIKHESLGELVFNDLTNGFDCTIKFASVKKKPSDFFTGEIKLRGITISKVYGSYLSFIEFNNVRYWDIRENVPIKKYEVYNQLRSSSLYREDRILLEQGKIDVAQEAKEKLEVLQRGDRKLREKYKSKK